MTLIADAELRVSIGSPAHYLSPGIAISPFLWARSLAADDLLHHGSFASVVVSIDLCNRRVVHCLNATALAQFSTPPAVGKTTSPSSAVTSSATSSMQPPP
jgi:hypothetical protein